MLALGYELRHAQHERNRRSFPTSRECIVASTQMKVPSLSANVALTRRPHHSSVRTQELQRVMRGSVLGPDDELTGGHATDVLPGRTAKSQRAGGVDAHEQRPHKRGLCRRRLRDVHGCPRKAQDYEHKRSARSPKTAHLSSSGKPGPPRVRRRTWAVTGSTSRRPQG